MREGTVKRIALGPRNERAGSDGCLGILILDLGIRFGLVLIGYLVGLVSSGWVFDTTHHLLQLLLLLDIVSRLSQELKSVLDRVHGLVVLWFRRP